MHHSLDSVWYGVLQAGILVKIVRRRTLALVLRIRLEILADPIYYILSSTFHPLKQDKIQVSRLK